MSSDIVLIAKKILVGVVVTVVPLLLLFAAIHATRSILGDAASVPATTNTR